MFKPLNTLSSGAEYMKTLLYAFHGWGKTTQAKHYQDHYGKGFIISGEAGLSSIKSAGIDYLPFSSFDGAVDESKGVFSFMSICHHILSDEFKAAGYKWIMLDSLTELSDQIAEWAKAKAEEEAAAKGKKIDGFAVYNDYVDRMLGACKFIRNLPYHVIVSALAKQDEDKDTGEKGIWPNVNYAKVQQQIPGIFDHVLCGTTAPDIQNNVVVGKKRIIITAELNGWHGKVRDESKVIKAVEETGNVTDILRKMELENA